MSCNWRLIMRYPLFVFVVICIVNLAGWAQHTSPNPDASSTSDEKIIEQLETDLLKAEQNTDPAVIDKIFSDDWISLTPTGLGPNKPAALDDFREHAGKEPPYFVHTEKMRIYVFGDSAVAAYVKAFKAK